MKKKTRSEEVREQEVSAKKNSQNDQKNFLFHTLIPSAICVMQHSPEGTINANPSPAGEMG